MSGVDRGKPKLIAAKNRKAQHQGILPQAVSHAKHHRAAGATAAQLFAGALSVCRRAAIFRRNTIYPAW
jgi:hypothetical protein